MAPVRLALYLEKQHPRAPMVRHLLRYYGEWYGVQWVEIAEDKESLAALHWTDQPPALKSSPLPQIFIPCAELSLPLEALPGENSPLWINVPAFEQALPLPECKEPFSIQNKLCILGTDLLQFLAHLIWRREELEPENYEASTKAITKDLPSARLGLMDAPWADYWILSLLNHLHPGLAAQARSQKTSVWMTHDIDCLRKWKGRSILRHLGLFVSHAVAFSTIKWMRDLVEAFTARDPLRDPWYTVPQILQVDRGISSDFFFLGHPRDHVAWRYDVRRPEYARLLQQCLSQGHQVGLHGNPLHANSLKCLQKERNLLRELGGSQVNISRQHYLKQIPGITMRYLDQAGFALDSTMGCNDRPGFRCATCVPLPWWDLEKQEPLQMRELSFVLGDWTLHNPQNFSAKKSMQILLDYAQKVRGAGGVLGLIFHDLYFAPEFTGHASFYAEVLNTLRQQNWKFWDSTSYLRFCKEQS